MTWGAFRHVICGPPLNSYWVSDRGTKTYATEEIQAWMS